MMGPKYDQYDDAGGFEEGYDEYLYSEEVNMVKVLTNSLDKDQLRASRLTAIYKVDDTIFVREKAEFAWRLKEMARKKHNKVRSDKPNTEFFSSFQLLFQMLMGEITKNPILNIFSHFLSLLTAVAWGMGCWTIAFMKTLQGLAILDSAFQHSQLMNVGTIRCSQVGVGNVSFVNQLGTSSDQKKALKAIQSSMSKGHSRNLDNMVITLGNSQAETQGRCRTRARVMACPDTGASRSLCGVNFAKSLGCKIHHEKISIQNASGTRMTYAGTVFFQITFMDQVVDVPVLLSADVEGRMIIGRFDLEAMRVITHDFPRVLPAGLFQKQIQ